MVVLFFCVQLVVDSQLAATMVSHLADTATDCRGHDAAM